MLRFVLANPYALRACMRLSSLKYELDMQVYPIHACPHHSFVKFTRKCVSFVLFSYRDHDLFRYEVCLYYEGRRCSGVNAFCYRYRSLDRCWCQRSDRATYDMFDDVHEQIRAQASHCFYTTCSRWRVLVGDIDGEEWFLNKLRVFDQACTPKTRVILRRYVGRLRKNARATAHATRTVTRRGFGVWKEWFFDPRNARGYMSRLRARYPALETLNGT